MKKTINDKRLTINQKGSPRFAGEAGLIQWIALIILAVALPAVLYLSQKTQIFKPRANFTIGTLVQVPGQPYACTQAQADGDRVDPGDQAGNCYLNGQLCTAWSAYHSYDVDNDQYYCVNSCAEPCQTPNPTPTPTPSSTACTYNEAIPACPATLRICHGTDEGSGCHYNSTVNSDCSGSCPQTPTPTPTTPTPQCGTQCQYSTGTGQCFVGYCLDGGTDCDFNRNCGNVPGCTYSGNPIACPVNPPPISTPTPTPQGGTGGTPPTAIVRVAANAHGSTSGSYAGLNMAFDGEAWGQDLTRVEVWVTDSNEANARLIGSPGTCSPSTVYTQASPCKVNVVYPLELGNHGVFVKAFSSGGSCSGYGEPGCYREARTGDPNQLDDQLQITNVTTLVPATYNVVLGDQINNSRCVPVARPCTVEALNSATGFNQNVCDRAAFRDQTECNNSAYFRAANTPVYCTRTGCQTAVPNRYDPGNTACYFSPNDCQARAAVSLSYTRQSAGGGGSSITSVCTQSGGVWRWTPTTICIGGNPSDPSTHCLVHGSDVDPNTLSCWSNYCPQVATTGQTPSCAANIPTTTPVPTNPPVPTTPPVSNGCALTGPTTLTAGQSGTYNALVSNPGPGYNTRNPNCNASGYPCAWVISYRNPATNQVTNLPPIPTTSDTFTFGENPPGSRPAGNYTLYFVHVNNATPQTPISACSINITVGTVVTPTPSPTPTPPVTRPVSYRVANVTSTSLCTHAALLSAMPTAAVWNSTTTSLDVPEWNLLSGNYNQSGEAKFVCAGFYDSTGNPLPGTNPIFGSINYRPSVTPTPTTGVTGCVCQSDNTCHPSCDSPSNPNRFVRYPAGSRLDNRFTIEYGAPGNSSYMSCAPTNSVAYNGDPDRNGFCGRSQRTKGDANGDGNIDTIVDFTYYWRAANGGRMPLDVNPDFSLNGSVGTDDLRIWQLTRGVTPR